MQVNIFPTSIWYLRKGENHPDDVLNWAMAQESGECVEKSNCGGFQSPSQGFENFPYIEYFQSQLEFLPAFNFINWWMNINRKGDYNFPHIHSGSNLSGVWYLTDNHEAPIHFLSPFAYTRGELYNAMNLPEGEYYMRCNAGDMLIFPSDLQHYVKPNTTEQPRVSIAFNLRLS